MKRQFFRRAHVNHEFTSSRSRLASRAQAEAHFLARLQAGDLRAWEEFVATWSPALYTYFFYNTQSTEITQAILQETLCRCVHSVASVDGNRPLRALIYTIAYQRLVEHWAGYGANPPPQPLRLPQLFVALGHLPQRAKQALLLRYLVGLSLTEIAIILGHTHHGTRSLLAQARHHLHALLTDGGD
ncbi:MAG: RNA polymerase sigma factor [Caldilineaceae bacterium]|nr:RNA polymerase sigma factor [Caldilineaceae bacterium]